ncbi:spinster family MFS transporter [Gemmatimonas phototrophica]|uniref:MFS transporter n=1 Tax=Gemmatimonas phototrophica TaxID=1379270 RepID=A0A143BL74_9BACT|nr:MFS transporter [Gemmatimonas phototrophica]AMW05194.1 MFS transporter [Gemmatimonas phototrophica]
MKEKSGYRYVVLAMLILAYTFNFLDRQILGILKEPIKRDLGLTDTQLGLMGGLAFAMLYSTLAVPIAWAADRMSRTWIMTGALTLWSGFTMACGAATGFWSLFLARVGVGFGEAGGVAPAYSLVSDYFPKEQRARALAAYSFGIPVGSALGTLFGGLMAAYVDWRFAFFAVGGAGVLLAPFFKWVVNDPVRGAFDGATAATPAVAPGFMDVVRTVLPKRTFWLLAVGAACSSVCGYGVAFWLPSFFMRSLNLTLAQTSVYYGLIQLFGGVAGIWLGGALSDRLGAKSKSAYALVPAVCFLVGLPLFLLAMNTQSLAAAFLLFLIPTGLNLAWLGPVVTAVQHLAPANMRSTTSSLFLLVNNLFGIAVGLWIFGYLSDLLAPTYGAESMRYAIYYGSSFYVVAATLLYLASRRLNKDWT